MQLGLWKTLLQALTALTVQLSSLIVYWDDNSNLAKLIIWWMMNLYIDGCGLQFLGCTDVSNPVPDMVFIW